MRTSCLSVSCFHHSSHFSAALLLGLASAAPALATGKAEFQPLGFLHQANLGPVIAYGISADGSLVVGQCNSSIGFQAFDWTAASGIVGLGAFDNPGGQGSGARACSADGSVIVGSSLLPDSLNEDGSPFRWTAQTGLVYLGSLGGTAGGVARGVSSDGSVIVGYSSNANFDLEAFRWTAATGMVGLGDLPGGVFNSQASAVSGDGSVIIGPASTTNGGYDRSFKWTERSGMQTLGPSTFRVIGISRDGHFAAGESLGRAARVNVDTNGLTMIPHLPLFNSDTDTAWAANADGSVIVGMENLSQFNGFFGRAFIWDAVHGTRILRDVLINDFGLGSQLAGWELNVATTVSDDGFTIAGYGFAPSGEQAAWRVKLPQPCAADINNNGAVNVDDLLAVINSWGACANPNNCPADIVPPGGNDLINVDDLLAVINGWGACP